MNADEALLDIEDRLAGAADALYHLTLDRGPTTHEGYRLEGKREGVLLAKGYVAEAIRALAGGAS